MRLRYTQQSFKMIANCQESPDVKLRPFALAFLSALFALCAPIRLFAGPDASKQFDPKLFQELQWRACEGSRRFSISEAWAGAFGRRMMRDELGSRFSIRRRLRRLGRSRLRRRIRT